MMKKNIILFSFTVFLSLFAFAQGKKSNEKFEKPIIRFLPAMQSCRTSETITNVTATGTIMIDYQIDDKANVNGLKINDEKTTLGDLNLQKCVIDVMKKIKFPKAPKGKTVSISYPVIFK